MCGIAGYFGTPNTPVPSAVFLHRMVEFLHHRGPDAHATHIAPGIGLGHARLSTIDITGGNQPMASTDGSVWLIFNGEIFNHVELRQEMEARGRVFATNSDTEVIL